MKERSCKKQENTCYCNHEGIDLHKNQEKKACFGPLGKRKSREDLWIKAWAIMLKSRLKEKALGNTFFFMKIVQAYPQQNGE